MSHKIETSLPRTVLVGAGVVGCEILRAHIDSEVPVWLVDQDAGRLQEAVRMMDLSADRWSVEPGGLLGDRIPCVRFHRLDSAGNEPRCRLVIESISERLEVKQSFLADAERWFGDEALLFSNTSTLRISNLAAALSYPERFCGMHFFMPVLNRPTVEVACGEQTSGKTVQQCCGHARRLGKEPLVVKDAPGFIVNRLLSPYLNEAMWLLCRGVSADRIEQAAHRYGMPMSPLELIDWIGARTMFDAGRVYWQSFPSRIRPAPLLAALVKDDRLGRSCGAGLYDYADGERSDGLSPVVLEMIERYRRDEAALDDERVTHLLAIPMWIEAAIALREGVVRSCDELDLAMRGGLGFDPQRSWLEYFDSIGSTAMLASIKEGSALTPAITAPVELLDCLEHGAPSQALEAFAVE